MKLRRTTATLIAMMLAAAAHAQVRNSIAIVRPQLTYEGTTTYLFIADYFKKDYPEISDYFRSMTKGGHGSGYLCKDEAGRVIVITAKHVVVFADKASLEFQKEGGKVVTIPDCPVLYRDDDVDFAAVLVPAEKVADLGDDAVFLEMAADVPADGAEVWSAGYPQLLNKPAWQLGKGTITNHHLVVEEVGLADSTAFIQHTAPIDPGNSGGPLVVGNPSDMSSIRVMGINTWMALGRQNANFAVSLENLKEAFGRIPQTQTTIDTASQAVEAKARDLIAELNKPDWSRFQANRYISYRMAAKIGWSTFTEGIKTEKEDAGKDWARRLFSSTVETLRQFIFYGMHKTLFQAGTPLEFVSIQPSTDISRGYRVEIARGKDIYSLDWIEETGSWHVAALILPKQIAPTTTLNPAAAKTTPPITRTPRALLFSASINAVPLITGWDPHPGIGAGYSFGILSWLTVGGTFDVSYASSLVTGNTQTLLSVYELSAFVHFNLPLVKIGLFPYLSLGYSAGLESGADRPAALSLAATGGLGLCYSTAGRISFGLEVIGRFGMDDSVIPRLENMGVNMFLTL